MVNNLNKSVDTVPILDNPYTRLVITMVMIIILLNVLVKYSPQIIKHALNYPHIILIITTLYASYLTTDLRLSVIIVLPLALLFYFLYINYIIYRFHVCHI